MTTKDEHYQYLLNKLDKAVEEEYFLEATWLSYSVIEDRVESAYRNATGSMPQGLFGAKLNSLKSVLSTHEATRKAFFGDMLNRIEVWKDRRNDLMHDLGGALRPKVEIEKEIKEVGTEGKLLAREFCAAVWRQKKMI